MAISGYEARYALNDDPFADDWAALGEAGAGGELKLLRPGRRVNLRRDRIRLQVRAINSTRSKTAPVDEVAEFTLKV